MEEVKLVLKPAYNARKINKEAYKEILRKTVPKVCRTKLIWSLGQCTRALLSVA